jgi:hypothetical protein
MTQERASGLPFAIAGLLTGVGTAWTVLLLTGRLDSDWLLAGILAGGFGVMALNAVHRVAPGAFALDASGRGEALAADTARSGGESQAANPRLRVLVTSSCLEALSVALLCAYYLDSLLIAVSSGVAFGLLGIAVSLALARRLAEPA